MIKRLLILVFWIIAVPCWGFDYLDNDCNDDGDDPTGITWCAAIATTTIDDSICDGRDCTGGDTIYLEPGTRGYLNITDVMGSVGSYINITNGPGGRVIISDTNNGPKIYISGTSGYLNITGDGETGHVWSADCKTDACYGIKLIHTSADSTGSGYFRVHDAIDNIKIGYIEIDGANNTSLITSAIQVQDGTLTDADVYDNYEIHHNYIHDVSYTSMYLGHNDPVGNTSGYTNDFSIHHNLIEDMGNYGMNLKGQITGSVSSIYDNIIRRTGTICNNPSAECYTSTEGDNYALGIKVLWSYGTAYTNIYNNWIEYTLGVCLSLGEAAHLVYNNTLLHCGYGTDNTVAGGHGILVHEDDYINNRPDRSVEIYDNKIVESNVYGISSGAAERKANVNRNIITESGTGELSGAGLTEGTDTNPGDCIDAWGILTNCANVYKTDADDICFTTWLDDADYSNDDFTLCCAYDYTSVGANLCGAASTAPWSGVSCQGCVMN